MSKLPTVGTEKIRVSAHIAITQQNPFLSVARSLPPAGDRGSLNVSDGSRRFGELRTNPGWPENYKTAQQSLSEPISNFVSAVYHKSKAVREYVESAGGDVRAGVSPALHSAAEPCRDRVEGPEEEACRQVLPVARRAEGGDNRNPWARDGQQAQRLPRRLSWAAWKNRNFVPKRRTAAASPFIHP